MFEAMRVFLPLLFAIVSGIIVMKLGFGFKDWNRNRRQPVLTVEAKVVTKRQHVSRSIRTDVEDMQQIHTHYYATFEVASGDRMEFRILSDDYAMLAEGDVGSLTFQGKKFRGFERHYGWVLHGKEEMLRMGSGS